jgi:hypothetical protein
MGIIRGGVNKFLRVLSSVTLLLLVHCYSGWAQLKSFTSVGVPKIHSKTKVRDEITLTTHRKPWRGPPKLKTKSFRGVTVSAALKKSLAEETRVMTDNQKKLYDKQNADQDNILKDVMAGKSLSPPPPPLPVKPSGPLNIKDFAKQAVGALQSLRTSGRIRYSNKPGDVLKQVVGGKFKLPRDIQGGAHSSYHTSVTPLNPPPPRETVDAALSRTHSKLAHNPIDKQKMEADWNKFISNKQNLLPPLKGGKQGAFTNDVRAAPNGQGRVQGQPVVGMKTGVGQSENQNRSPVDIDSFDPFEHVTEMTEKGKKRPPQMQSLPAQKLQHPGAVLRGAGLARTNMNEGVPTSLSMQILNSEPKYSYTRLPRNAWPQK